MNGALYADKKRLSTFTSRFLAQKMIEKNLKCRAAKIDKKPKKYIIQEGGIVGWEYKESPLKFQGQLFQKGMKFETGKRFFE